MCCEHCVGASRSSTRVRERSNATVQRSSRATRAARRSPSDCRPGRGAPAPPRPRAPTTHRLHHAALAPPPHHATLPDSGTLARTTRNRCILREGVERRWRRGVTHRAGGAGPARCVTHLSGRFLAACSAARHLQSRSRSPPRVTLRRCECPTQLHVFSSRQLIDGVCHHMLISLYP